jgi:hypothetical protein
VPPPAELKARLSAHLEKTDELLAAQNKISISASSATAAVSETNQVCLFVVCHDWHVCVSRVILIAFIILCKKNEETN